jgi:hypothetical protein
MSLLWGHLVQVSKRCLSLSFFILSLSLFLSFSLSLSLSLSQFLTCLSIFQVGKIHQRRLLDDDKREIRLIQEAFLEDGELHSEQGRERKFRWKGIGEEI